MSEDLFVEAGDARLAVRIDGPAGAPWLILSNSLATDMRMWEPQIAELSAHRRLVRYDTRGHGRSSAPGGPYRFDLLVGDVVAILDRLDIETTDILGLSLGGMTALGFGLAHPERVRGLICCAARGDFPAAAIAAWDQRMAAVEQGGMAAIVDETLARWFTPATARNRPDVVNHARAMMLATSAEGYRGCAAALQALDYRRRLPDLRSRTLYLAGEADGAAPPAVMREMAEATPNAQFEIAPGAAHIVNLEATTPFNATVRRFLLADDGDDDAVARL